MEVIARGLEILDNAIGVISCWAGLVCLASIAALTCLIYTDKLTLEQLKDFFSKDKRYK